MRFYRSARVARYHPTFRPHGMPPLPPTYQVVAGYPEDCRCTNRIAIVGEGPGADEDQAGFPFVGRSGEELDRGLDAYGIDPDSCFITNIGRIFKLGNPDPTAEDIEMWEPLLWEELNAAKPHIIVAVGRIASRHFLGDVDMDTVHGIPFQRKLAWLDNGRDGLVTILPVVHPAAGFRSTEAQALTAYDFAQLGATVKGRITPRDPNTADKFPNPDYRDLTDSPEDLATIEATLAGGSRQFVLKVAIDTEGLPGNPWGLSYSVQDGQAFVIRKVHGLALRTFYRWLVKGIDEGRIHVLLHNSLHDLRVLRELGIPLPDNSYTDTMVLSYHLCIEPQGLKPLASRHAGMEMHSYDEIVQEAQDRIAVDYYEMIEAMVAGGIEYRQPEREELVFKLKQGKTVVTELTADSQEEYESRRAEYVEAGYGVSNPRRRKVPPTDPVRIGPFRYIEPYEVFEIDPATGERKTRMKRTQQVDTRVNKALKELREGKITAAQLRKRWDQTDELVVSIVEEVVGPMREADLNDVPLDKAVWYAARDADATHRIEPILSERHRAMGLDRVRQIDHAIIPMVDEMQAVGYPVDVDYFRWLSADLARRMLEVQQRIKTEFGVWINPNSGDQVSDLLFGEYGLVPTKFTKGRVNPETGEVTKVRGSTQDKVISGLRDAHPIIPLIEEFRGYNKAKTSFADVVIRRAVHEYVAVEWDNDDEPTRYEWMWVIHCNFRITRVSSGRMSATGPNLMAVMGGTLGREIRRGYIAGEGYQLAEWDLNQIEMRGMASESGDEFLISMIMSGEDIHTGTADRMFHLGLTRPYNKKQVDDEKHRDPAKRTGFGVITGIQAPGLVDQMRLQGIIVSEDEAGKWIVDWLAACPKVPEYMQACMREAMAYGYVRDWAGRIRYLPGIHSPFRHIRAEAGRQSHSHKIQAGAQEIMKIAMATIHREVIPYWRAKGKFIVPTLQIHDALKLRIKGFSEEEFAELDAQMRAAMFSAAPPDYKVPLDAGHGVATNWGDLKH